MTRHDAALSRALDGVGPRLQAFRERLGLTLTEVSDLTGISRSTLSRLETGQRRPSLELLLPLAGVYRVPLDELVGAPETGDPRVRLRPQRVNGRTVVPLTRHPGNAFAWKIIVPPEHSTPALKAHRGMSWIYVLSGRLRLVVGEEELQLGPGEVAEFDTMIPHWFGSDGAHEAEILTIFGPDSEPTGARSAKAGRGCADAHAA